MTSTSMKPSPHQVVHALSITLIPLLLIVFALIYTTDRRLYLRLLREDSLVEWLTFFLFLFSGILSLFMAMQILRRSGRYRWFFMAFSLFCILVSLEEINWGQRIFDLPVPEFFLRNTRRREISAHNVFQLRYDVDAKHIAGWTLFLYGTCLPLLALNRRISSFFARMGFVVPPPVLSFSFFIAALMMFDRPTGWEEEIGEFFFGLCFFLFMLMEHLKLETQNIGSGPKSHGKQTA